MIFLHRVQREASLPPFEGTESLQEQQRQQKKTKRTVENKKTKTKVAVHLNASQITFASYTINFLLVIQTQQNL